MAIVFREACKIMPEIQYFLPISCADMELSSDVSGTMSAVIVRSWYSFPSVFICCWVRKPGILRIFVDFLDPSTQIVG